MADKLGVGILATGWVSNEHIKAFQKNPHTEVMGILSRDRGRAEAKAAEHGLRNCQTYTDLDAMLGNDDIRIVAICTPHHLHAEQGIACAQAGRHVLVEKPIALDLESLHALDDAIRKAGVRSVVSFVLRWNPLVETIKQMLKDGWLGELFYAETDYMHPIESSYTGYEWIRCKEFGGNNMLTGGCHAVDALRWFAGGKAVEVFAYGNTGKHNRLGFGYDTNMITSIKFDNGVIAKVGCSIEAHMPYVFNIVLMGEKGTVRNNQVFSSHWPGQTGWATIPTILPDTAEVGHHPFAGEINHFVDCIRSGDESHCNVADAVETHEVCIAAEISAREGRPVKLPLK